MLLARSGLMGRSTPQQQHAVPGSQASTAPLATASPRKGLIGWAMSAFGRRPSAAAAAASTAEIAAAAAGGAAVASSALPSSSVGEPRPPGRLRVAIVGDVHGAWRPDREEAALRLLAPHITLLVGDFGNENVELVRQVSELSVPKAVILGNHDAWFTMTNRGGANVRRSSVQQNLSAADLLGAMTRGEGIGPEQDGVRKQLASLGSSHVGYGTLPLEEQGYTVVGARPFSKGGKNFTNIRPFMEGLYGVTSMEESTYRIVQVATSAAEPHALIMMGHNGPAGLGSRPFDPCGVDWEGAKGGDHGDPDLQSALAELHRQGRRVSLVTFGHMHHHLSHRSSAGTGQRLRRMVALDPATGTVYLNAATVPRVTVAPHPHPSSSTSSPHGSPPGASSSPTAAAAASHSPLTSPKSYGSGKRARMAAKAAIAAARALTAHVGLAAAQPGHDHGHGGAEGHSDQATVHHFMVVELEGGEVVKAQDVWVQVTPVTEETAEAVMEALTAVTATLATTAAAAAVGNEEGTSALASALGGEAGAPGDGGGWAAVTAAAAEEAEGEWTATGTAAADRTAAEAGAAGPRRVGGFAVHTLKQHMVLRTVPAAEGDKVVKFVWNAYDQRYESYVLDRCSSNGYHGTLGGVGGAADGAGAEDGGRHVSDGGGGGDGGSGSRAAEGAEVPGAWQAQAEVVASLAVR